MAGFFIWSIFVYPNGGIFNKVLGLSAKILQSKTWADEVNQIGSKIFIASLSPDYQNKNTVSAIGLEPDVLANNDSGININSTVDDNASQNLTVTTGEDVEDQLDDIQEKIDIISQQVQALVAKQNQNNPPAEVVSDADKDKTPDDKNDQDKNNDQDNEQNPDDKTENHAAEITCTGQININTASLEDLDKITQVGLATAQKIIQARPFYSLNDLLNVGGIGEITLQEIIQQGCAYVESGFAGGGGGGGGAVAPVVYPKILISEVQSAGATDDKQEFVELYNPNNQDVDLTNWYLQRKTAGSSDWSTYVSNNLFLGKTILANGYFLIARTGYYLGVADVFTDNPITNDNSFALKNPNGDISDKVGFGSAQDFESQSTVNPGDSQSIGRKVLSDGTEQDTDNNSVDFELDTPTPRAQNITYVAPPAPTLTAISITTPSDKLNYNVGDYLDISDLVVTGTYSDNSTQIEPITTANVTGFDSSTPITGQVLTITFNGQTITYTVNINQPADITLPSITTYVISNLTISPNGDGVDDTTSIDLAFSEKVNYNIYILSGATIIKSWSGSATNPDAKVWDGKDNSGAIVSDGIYTIKIVITNSAKNSFTDTSKTITVDNVIPPAPALESIAITTPATKLNYNIGDLLDISGLVLTGTYSDNSTQVENITTANVTGFDSSTPITGQVLTITFNGQTTTYAVNITVQNNAVAQLKIISSAQTVEPNNPSGVFTVESQNTSGVLTKVLATTYVNLSSDSSTGLFSSAPAGGPCGTDWTKTSVTISKNTANKSFCYKDSTSGTYTITVSATGLSSDSQTVIVSP